VYKETITKKLEIMKSLRIARTVHPPFEFSSYNEWAQWFWGLYGKELERIKNQKSWNRNIYKPLKK
jgi:hypothetical protein